MTTRQDHLLKMLLGSVMISSLASCSSPFSPNTFMMVIVMMNHDDNDDDDDDDYQHLRSPHPPSSGAPPSLGCPPLQILQVRVSLMVVIVMMVVIMVMINMLPPSPDPAGASFTDARELAIINRANGQRWLVMTKTRALLTFFVHEHDLRHLTRPARQCGSKRT